MCVCVCVCVLDSLVTQGGLMAIQGLCPFSWSTGLNLACESEEEEEKRRSWRKEEWRRSAKMKWRLSDVATARRP